MSGLGAAVVMDGVSDPERAVDALAFGANTLPLAEDDAVVWS